MENYLNKEEKRIVTFIKRVFDKTATPVIADKATFNGLVATVRKVGAVKCVDFNSKLSDSVINSLNSDYRIDCNWDGSHRITVAP